MAYIVPYYRMTEDICETICDNVAQVRVYRFMDSEFQKFKQVAVLGTRKKRSHLCPTCKGIESRDIPRRGIQCG